MNTGWFITIWLRSGGYMMFGPLTEKLSDQRLAFHKARGESISDITQEFLEHPPASYTQARNEAEIGNQIDAHKLDLVIQPVLEPA